MFESIKLWFLRLRKDERGNVAPLVAIMLTVLLGSAGMVVDGGLMFETRRFLQNGTDGAALAGAWEYTASGFTDTSRIKAEEYASRNGLGTDPSDIISVSFSTVGVNPAITVTASRRVDFMFARALGINDTVVEASATAIVADAAEGDIYPWAIPQSSLGPGGTYLLKVGAPDGEDGFFRSLRLCGNGSSDYIECIEEGYNGPIPPIIDESHPWGVDSEQGNMPKQACDAINDLVAAADLIRAAVPPSIDCNPTDGIVDDKCPDIGWVPVGTDDSMDDSGLRTVDIVGFVAVQLIHCDFSGGHTDYTANVISSLKTFRHGGGTTVGGPLSGSIGVRLWR
jgi:Flp pilus assembly protein TadG